MPNTKNESAIEEREDGPYERKTGRKIESPLDLRAYYYSFDPTGVDAIDKILAAVASAGKRHHHTEGWSGDLSKESPVGAIQDAANQAAKLLQDNDKMVKDRMDEILP